MEFAHLIPLMNRDRALQLMEDMRKAGLVSSKIQYMWQHQNVFNGREVVQWMLQTKRAMDIEEAVSIGQSLLDHRLAHQIMDEDDFKNEDILYRMYCDEPLEVQQKAAEFDALIASAKLVGNVKLRFRHMFLDTVYEDCFMVLHNNKNLNNKLDKRNADSDDVLMDLEMETDSNNTTSTSGSSNNSNGQYQNPGILYLYRSRSAPAPFITLQVQECTCDLTECVDCLQNWYCFTIRSNKYGTYQIVEITACVGSSEEVETWMYSLYEGGVQFNKVDEGIVEAKSLFEFAANDLTTGELIPLSSFKGRVCLVINVSSNCGLAPRHYTELVQLHNKYASKGLSILAFPSNQFGQEPGNNKDIRKFADSYGARFQMFSKVAINGKDAHPLFKFLKQNLGGILGSSIKWNFTKFLCDRDGKPIRRYSPTTTPSMIAPDIERLLAS